VLPDHAASACRYLDSAALRRISRGRVVRAVAHGRLPLIGLALVRRGLSDSTSITVSCPKNSSPTLRGPSRRRRSARTAGRARPLALAALDAELAASAQRPATTPKSFADLGLPAPIVGVLDQRGIREPSEIQGARRAGHTWRMRGPRACADRVRQDAGIRPAAADPPACSAGHQRSTHALVGSPGLGLAILAVVIVVRSRPSPAGNSRRCMP
jgi:hypothetical protein